jgi:nitrogen fixation/metabolism regulation signal transduction histidine kinase
MNKNRILIPAILLVVVFAFAFFSILEKNASEKLKSVYSVASVSQTSSGMVRTDNQNLSQNVTSTRQDLPKSATSTITEEILFYGDGCPHCANVENFINSNGVLGKTSLIEKEVYNNKDNFNEFSEKAKLCGIDSNSLVVPFLWDGSQCILGDTPIIDYLKNQIAK